MTLIEVLISFSIFLILASFIPLVMSVWKTPDVKSITHEERVLFLVQLHMDFRKSNTFWTNNIDSILYFDNPDDNTVIQYEFYQNKIRRRVNGSGHEVFLQKVKYFKAERKSYGVKITVESIDGRKYEKVILHPGGITDAHLQSAPWQ